MSRLAPYETPTIEWLIQMFLCWPRNVWGTYCHGAFCQLSLVSRRGRLHGDLQPGLPGSESDPLKMKVEITWRFNFSPIFSWKIVFCAQAVIGHVIATIFQPGRRSEIWAQAEAHRHYVIRPLEWRSFHWICSIYLLLKQSLWEKGILQILQSDGLHERAFFLQSCPLTWAELSRDELCNGFFKHRT